MALLLIMAGCASKHTPATKSKNPMCGTWQHKQYIEVCDTEQDLRKSEYCLHQAEQIFCGERF